MISGVLWELPFLLAWPLQLQCIPGLWLPWVICSIPERNDNFRNTKCYLWSSVVDGTRGPGPDETNIALYMGNSNVARKSNSLYFSRLHVSVNFDWKTGWKLWAQKPLSSEISKCTEWPQTELKRVGHENYPTYAVPRTCPKFLSLSLNDQLSSSYCTFYNFAIHSNVKFHSATKRLKLDQLPRKVTDCIPPWLPMSSYSLAETGWKEKCV